MKFSFRIFNEIHLIELDLTEFSSILVANTIQKILKIVKKKMSRIEIEDEKKNLDIDIV